MENACSSKKKGKQLLASLAPGFLDPLSPDLLPHCNNSKFKPAIVSDMSEIASLNTSELVTYLEFQPALIQKVVETLRSMEKELIVKDEMLRSAEKVKDELRSEKSQVEIERQKYKVICDERSEKIVYLEEMNKEDNKELKGKCAKLSCELDKLNKKVTLLDMEKSKAFSELEVYKSKCNELSEKVVELTKYKVGLDDLIEKFTPNREVKRNQEDADGEVNKKRKLADEPHAVPYVQAKGCPTESESSDDSSESDSCNEIPASKLRKVQSSSEEGEGSSDEVSMHTCHQCSKEVPVLQCKHCKKTRYCFSCIKKWYPQMSHKDIKKMCPCCRGNCHCRLCASRVGKSKEGINLGVKLTAYKKKSSDLTLATVAHYFYMPIKEAAKEMNVGCSFLKKRCRKMGIPRWPYRKLMSLQSLIKTFQEMELQEDVDKLKIRGEIKLLEEQMKLIMEMPEMYVEEKTKKLRQSCSKINYMQKREEL